VALLVFLLGAAPERRERNLSLFTTFGAAGFFSVATNLGFVYCWA
jgi:hypothetical protein